MFVGVNQDFVVGASSVVAGVVADATVFAISCLFSFQVYHLMGTCLLMYKEKVLLDYCTSFIVES